MVTSITEEFTSIAASFAALVEGLSYIDEDVAERIAVEFADKLVKATRSVYAEMASKVATELAKPAKKKGARRRRVVATTIVPVGQPAGPVGEVEVYQAVDNYEPMGTEPLPENPRSFINSGPIGMDELDSDFAERLTGGEVKRGPTPSPGRSMRQPIEEQPTQSQGAPRTPKRMSSEDADSIPESERR